MKLNIKILLVDDEFLQLQSISLGLSHRGYDVVTASNASDALKMIREEESLDVLLTDMSMPGKSGLELAREVRALRPELPIIVITGLRNPRSLSEIRDLGIPIVQKPFEPLALDRIIRENLGRPPLSEKTHD